MANPEKIGRYEIKGELGRGGFATVYRAYDPRFEREVAIKFLPPELIHSDPQFRMRFEREAKIIAQLEHPAIVPVYDVGEENNQPYFVMRYMTGGSLSDRIRKGALTLQEAARIMNRLAPALEREIREARHRAEHRAALEMLKDSEARFRAMASSLPGMVFQLLRDAGGEFRFLFVGDGEATYQGMIIGEAAKEGDWEAIWPWEKTLFEKQGRTVAVGATPWKK